MTLDARVAAIEETLRRQRERGPERILIPIFNAASVQIAEVEGLQASSNITLARQTGDKRRLGTIAASGGSGSALTVREEDGTPSDTAVTIIRVPNGGGMVDNGVGDVSLTYEIAGSIATHAGAADPHTGYVLESVIDAAGDLYRGSADNAVARLAAPTSHHFLGGTGVAYHAAIEAGVYASRPAASTANIGRLYRATDRANTLYQCADASTWVVVNPRAYTMGWYIDGRLRADASNAQGPIRYLPDLDGMTTESVALWKPVRCKAHLRVASAGASVIVQIEFGTTATPGTDLFASGDRPTIAAASVEATSTTFTDSAIENGTAFELIIDQVGSTSAQEGTDLSVELEFVQIDA